jgi:hypothetical protein
MISKTDPCKVQQNIIFINWERLTFSALDNKVRKFIGCLSEVVDMSSGWLVGWPRQRSLIYWSTELVTALPYLVITFPPLNWWRSRFVPPVFPQTTTIQDGKRKKKQKQSPTNKKLLCAKKAYFSAINWKDVVHIIVDRLIQKHWTVER